MALSRPLGLPRYALLDFGCGDGQISEYIAQHTGADVTGVNCRRGDPVSSGTHVQESVNGYVSTAPTWKLRRMRFRKVFRPRPGDRQPVFRQGPAGNDPAPVGAPGPRWQNGRFLCCTATDSLWRDETGPGYRCPGVAYRVQDYSAQNRPHWLVKKQDLQELEPLFKAEGSYFLFKNRLAECDGMVDTQRYLYLIEADPSS